jgi:transcription-repair coupling factor (superfamily II helicase)
MFEDDWELQQAVTKIVKECSHDMDDDWEFQRAVAQAVHECLWGTDDEIDVYKKLLQIKQELEDRFGKINKTMEIYMFEEWFEKQPKEIGITTVRQNDREIEIELPKELSSKIEGDKFFIKAYNINPRFRLKYLHEQIIIALTLLNQKEHFLYYVVPLMEEILEEIKEK